MRKAREKAESMLNHFENRLEQVDSFLSKIIMSTLSQGKLGEIEQFARSAMFSSALAYARTTKHPDVLALLCLARKDKKHRQFALQILSENTTAKTSGLHFLVDVIARFANNILTFPYPAYNHLKLYCAYGRSHIYIKGLYLTLYHLRTEMPLEALAFSYALETVYDKRVSLCLPHTLRAYACLMLGDRKAAQAALQARPNVQASADSLFFYMLQVCLPQFAYPEKTLARLTTSANATPTSKPWSIFLNVTLGKPIKSGAYGEVIAVTYPKTQSHPLVLKKYTDPPTFAHLLDAASHPNDFQVEASFRETLNEIYLMATIDCPSILPLSGITIHDGFIAPLFPRYDDNVYRYLKDDDKIIHQPLAFLLNALLCLGSALAYLYEHNILHRDIKSGNMLVRIADYEMVLCDFGMSRRLGPEICEYGISSKVEYITPWYAAPEVTQFNYYYYSHKADIYSGGVVILELLTYLDDIPKMFGLALLSIAHGCLAMNPRDRPDGASLYVTLLELIRGSASLLERSRASDRLDSALLKLPVPIYPPKKFPSELSIKGRGASHHEYPVKLSKKACKLYQEVKKPEAKPVAPEPSVPAPVSPVRPSPKPQSCWSACFAAFFGGSNREDQEDIQEYRDGDYIRLPDEPQRTPVP